MIEENNILQVRVNAGTGTLHIQGKGEIKSNREYGYADKFTVPTECTDWLAFKSPTHQSFASDSIVYIRGVTLREYKNCTALYIGDGDDKFVLHLNTDSPRSKELIDFALQNDLIEDYTSEYELSGKMEEE